MSLFRLWQTNSAKTRSASEDDDAHAYATQLGASVVALRVARATPVPPHCVAYALGQTTLLQSGAILPEGGYLVAPGPYQCEVLPQTDCPELALRLTLVFDSDEQPPHRFALMLLAEAPNVLTLAELQTRIQTNIWQHAAEGFLQIETCPSAQEWQAYRSALEKLIFTRYGCLLENCLPQDVGLQVDYADQFFTPAAVKLANGASKTEPAIALSHTSQNHATDLRQVCHRFWLELPALCQAWRLLPWPSDSALYRRWQAVEQGLDALDSILAHPPQHLLHTASHERAQRLLDSLEQAWAHLARLQVLSEADLPPQMAQLEDFCQQWQAEFAVAEVAP